ncbi:MFS transporter [Plastoroseomonas hellenica]|uniref:MFS transporter n=1 Tax=Plastoroseomonas hellenica TaxID=2687306 RepID=UPI0020127263|nr:MFS transporter [Plastoroseomonas hellenica]MBR0647069.1 MFS transporter [Plastoroseomonas hellenica]
MSSASVTAGAAGVSHGPALDGWVVLAMAATCGLAVANIYYNQPMMAEMAASFGLSSGAAGAVPTAAQAGYAIGLLFLAPLGDRLERRGLMLRMLAALVLALAAAAAAPSFAVLIAASFLTGALATVAQHVVPMAAHLATPARRGRVVGTVMAGLLIGILAARTVSGVVVELLDWRAMFWIAAGLMAVTAVVVRLVFPKAEATSRLPYPQLMASLLDLFRRERVLREAAFEQAMLFGAFSIFWSTLTLHLASPAYHLGPAAAGLFGLIGIVGVLAAPFSGRLADRGAPRRMVGLGILLALASFAIFALFGESLAGLVAGVILLDLGVQGAQISNQTRIFALQPEARARINTIYMVTVFAGGALGSAAGTVAWTLGGWPAVTGCGLIFCAVSLAIFGLARRR